MRKPNGDERMIAMALLQRMALEPEQQAILQHIEKGEESSADAFNRMRRLANVFVATVRERGKIRD